MRAKNSIKLFIEKLSSQDVNPEIVFNQYHEEYNFPQFLTTKMNLLFYLSQMKEIRPKTILVGEAPGRNGCAITGIPFTSLHILSKQNKFGLFGFQENYDSKFLQKENTATMVWDVLEKLNFCPLLWNAFPFNPIDKITNKNRKPTTSEIDLGVFYLKEIIEIFEITQFVAVGKVASAILNKFNCDFFEVPHPSYGNKYEFYEKLKKLIDEKKIVA